MAEILGDPVARSTRSHRLVKGIVNNESNRRTTKDIQIPTLLAYRNGQCKACGAEALEYVDDNQYDMAKWFKVSRVEGKEHLTHMSIASSTPIFDENF